MAGKEMTTEEIKRQIDELRDEWDRLDAEGSQATRQNMITQRIERLQEKLKELYNETY